MSGTDLVWLNGAILAREAARIDPDDRGFLLGDGAFETLRMQAGRPRRWARHRARLAGALERLQIASPDWGALEAGLAELARRLGFDAAMARVTVSRGAGGRGFETPPGRPGTVLAALSAQEPAPRAVALGVIDAPRREPTSLAARFKPIGYGDALHARRLARAAGADMAAMLSSQGALASADCANLFWIIEERVFTPALSSGALAGTTRAALNAAARAAGVTVEEGLWAPSVLAQCEAAFITNARLGVHPVGEIEGRALAADHRLVARMAALERAAE